MKIDTFEQLMNELKKCSIEFNQKKMQIENLDKEIMTLEHKISYLHGALKYHPGNPELKIDSPVKQESSQEIKKEENVDEELPF